MFNPLKLRAAGLAVVAAALMCGAAQAADIPRTGDGKPDLSGIWQSFSRADDNLLPHAASKDGPASLGSVVGGEIPYLPAALAKRDENFRNREKADPRSKCYVPGVPRLTYAPFPFQILQSDKGLAVFYEYAHWTRNIYANGTEHPPGKIDWWVGDSRGRWDGDTLVVSVKHFNGLTWLDHAGNYYSDNAEVTERWTLIDADHLNYRATIQDDKVFSKPWTIEVLLYRRKEPQVQLLEYECYLFDYEKYYP